jgi:hypothetical protein
VTYKPKRKIIYNHIGAIFTDVVLQSGLNYSTVVKPRVNRILTEYPDAKTVSSFGKLLSKQGTEKILKWKHNVKKQRMSDLMTFAQNYRIETCHDLRRFFEKSSNRSLLLDLNGFGPKTLDYLLKLLGFDTVAVDRHIYNFVALAGIEKKDYYETKRVVEYAADFLNLPRAVVDYSIWKYMSYKDYSEINTQQMSLNFY